MKKFIIMNPEDNCATALEDISKGSQLQIIQQHRFNTCIVNKERIPYKNGFLSLNIFSLYCSKCGGAKPFSVASFFISFKISPQFIETGHQ